MMKKAIYIHGAFSAYDEQSDKVINLKKEFEVVGVSYSMEETFQENIDKFKELAIKENVDFAIGTSLGGLYAAELSHCLNIKGVLVNPCIEPQNILHKIIGNQKNYSTGNNENFTKELSETFYNPILNEDLMIFVGMNDNIISPQRTIDIAKKNNIEIHIDKDADHRWQFFEENNKIMQFLNKELK